ncbi:MAG: UDP-N-acetylglucosamine 2-epimerase (hydrolyzing) [Phycisphaerales bacterium]|nr:UDP-N-acetylglucosamine 2-epimerase (hydrolyzing) [Phycisphaerales bacterium]
MDTARRILVVTGTRAEFGLLAPIMRAIQAHEALRLIVIAAGAHLIAPALTLREVRAAFDIADSVPMQIAGRTGRMEDAHALGRGVARFARIYERLTPDVVLVLGDRIEAFAAASAACIAGICVAHVHAGDRAEGVADEAMRHATTKLAHLLFAASPASAERLRRMGEDPHHVHLVGSPAIDTLPDIAPMTPEAFADLGSPSAVLLFHPIGRDDNAEKADAIALLDGLRDERVLAIHPNHDPGRDGIVAALHDRAVRHLLHLPRAQFVALLKRLALNKGVLVGNSSAGLIESAAIPLATIDAGPRQGGRERCANVVSVETITPDAIRAALAAASAIDLSRVAHTYGDGASADRIARVLAATDPHDPRLLRKRCTY